MTTFRQEVHEFVRASETLLSPASPGLPLTKQEREIVQFYASSLNEHCAGLNAGGVLKSRELLGHSLPRY